MMIELQTLWSSLLLYVLAGSLAIVGVVFKRPQERVVLAMLATGLLLHTAAIALRWNRLDHGPFLTMFEILLSNVWSMLTVYTICYWRIPALRSTAAIVMPMMFVMMGWLLMTNPGEGHMPPTYHTIWLYIHIGFGKVFLGALLVAVGISGIILARGSHFGKERFANLPDDIRLNALSIRFLAISLIFESLMLIAGAIWAQDAWGRYWAWDPLETWAFLTWLSLVLTMHARLTYKITPRASAIMVICVFVVAFLTFFGIPFITPVAHQGAV